MNHSEKNNEKIPSWNGMRPEQYAETVTGEDFMQDFELEMREKIFDANFMKTCDNVKSFVVNIICGNDYFTLAYMKNPVIRTIVDNRHKKNDFWKLCVSIWNEGGT